MGVLKETLKESELKLSDKTLLSDQNKNNTKSSASSNNSSTNKNKNKNDTKDTRGEAPLLQKDSKDRWEHKEVKEVRFIPKWIKEVHEPTGNFSYTETLTEEEKEAIYGIQGTENYSGYPQNVVEGITKEYTAYIPMNIAFGYKKEYYDFTF